MLPLIFGLSGTQLSNEEQELFAHYKPQGFILFSRNIHNLFQIEKLTSELRNITGSAVPILIDQEGGRVARLRPPIFRECKPAKHFVDLVKTDMLFACEELYRNYYDITCDLLKLGINVNCVPCADLYYDYANKIIGDRSFGDNPSLVSFLCLKVIKAVTDAKGKYIIKHIPGHGRALLDSHLDLPIIKDDYQDLMSTDFKVFKTLAQSNLEMAMTAHIIYTCLDPSNPVTLSKDAIKFIRHELGFLGTLISDDISMKALRGNIEDIACRALDAGCNIILHCNGDIKEMKAIAKAIK